MSIKNVLGRLIKNQHLINRYQGISLDIACGANKQSGFIGIDIRGLPNVDIQWDLLRIPWPLPSESVNRAICSHFIEHIPPVQITDKGTRFPFVEFMGEVWRVMRVGGEFAISFPHGSSQGFLQDPTHINACNENTFYYFDPDPEKKNIGGALWRIYRPLPYQVKYLAWNPSANVEVVLVKRELKNYE